MPVKEASSEVTPYGRYVTSEGWFVHNLADALAVRNEEKGARCTRSSRGRRRSLISASTSASSGRATRARSTARRGCKDSSFSRGSLMIGARPEVETIRYAVSDVAAKYGASAGKETDDPEEAYADWPGEYLPMRVAWPLDFDAKR
jgi:hypothetical protein